MYLGKPGQTVQISGCINLLSKKSASILFIHAGGEKDFVQNALACGRQDRVLMITMNRLIEEMKIELRRGCSPTVIDSAPYNISYVTASSNSNKHEMIT